MERKFKLIAEYPECVIIQKEMDDGYYKTQVRDNEGDIIMSSVRQSKTVPAEFFTKASTYSLAEIRRIRMEEELKWRRVFVET